MAALSILLVSHEYSSFLYRKTIHEQSETIKKQDAAISECFVQIEKCDAALKRDTWILNKCTERIIELQQSK